MRHFSLKISLFLSLPFLCLCSPWIAIDLGSSGVSVGYVKPESIKEGEEPEVILIPDADDLLRTPSFFRFENNGSVVYGQKAKEEWAQNPSYTLYNFLNFLGWRYNDTASVENREKVFYTTKERNNQTSLVVFINNEPASISVEGLILFQLIEMKERAERVLGEPVSKVLITVPSYANNNRRQLTQQIAEVAGFTEVKLITQSLILAFGHRYADPTRGVFVSLYIGANSLEASIVDCDSFVFELLSTSGTAEKGGEFILDLLSVEAKKKLQNLGYPMASKAALVALRAELEKKVEEHHNQKDLEIDPMIPGIAKSFKVTLSYKEIQEALKPASDLVLAAIQDAMSFSGYTMEQLKNVYLSGGYSFFRPLIEASLNIPETKSNEETAQLEVATGLAVYAGYLNAGTLHKVEQTATYDLGFDSVGGFLYKYVSRTRKLPYKRREEVTTYMNNQETIRINIFEGFSRDTHDMYLVGSYFIHGVEPARYGVPRIEVIIDCNENGVISLNARKLGEDFSEKITITNNRIGFNPPKSKNCFGLGDNGNWILGEQIFFKW